MTGLELPGFADPVTGAQTSFRALLDAMSRPGTQHEVAPLRPPPPLGPAMAAALLTLVDRDTPLWLDDASTAAREWLLFHCGAQVTADPAAAAFAAAIALPSLGRFNPGSDAAPEESATIILQVPELGSGESYRLSGPGLAAPSLLRIQGLPADFPAQWGVNHALYPCGIDLILCSGSRLCALPRSVSIEKV